MYELRETTTGANPAERGILIATFPTYRAAFRRWQELNASGRSVYVIRVSE